MVGRPRELDVAVLVRAPRVHEGDVGPNRRDGEELVAAVGIDGPCGSRAPRRAPTRAPRGSAGTALPSLPRAARRRASTPRARGRRSAPAATARPKPARQRRAGPGRRSSTTTERSAPAASSSSTSSEPVNVIEVEIALPGAGERARGRDRLAAQHGPAEGDRRAVRDEGDGVVPSPRRLTGGTSARRFSRKAVQALARLGLGERLDRRLPLDREPCLEARVVAVVQAALDQAQTRRRHLREPGCELERLLARGLRRRRRPRRRGRSRAASAALSRSPRSSIRVAARAADEPRQPLRAAAAGDDPEADLGAADQRRPVAP